MELDISVSQGNRESACREVFYVVDQESQTLLGMPAIEAQGLIPAIETISVGDSVVASESDRVLAEFKEVFDGLGKYHTPVKLQLKQGTVWNTAPARHMPEKVSDKLRVELYR